MSRNNIPEIIQNKMSDWVTTWEASRIANQLTSIKITDSDIYLNALYGNICLSIYFQSPIYLRKVQTSYHKVKLRPAKNSTIHRLGFLDKDYFLSGRDLIVSTENDYIVPKERILDTTLADYKYVIIQYLLARTLNIPLPVIGANGINYGISVIFSGEIFQVF